MSIKRGLYGESPMGSPASDSDLESRLASSSVDASSCLVGEVSICHHIGGSRVPMKGAFLTPAAAGIPGVFGLTRETG